MADETVVPIHAGASQLLAALCDELGVEQIVNQMVRWDRKQWTQSPGTHIKAMIINALCARRPLYRVQKFFADLDVEMLFGTDAAATDFNDDALSRTLDRIHEAGSWRVYSTLALSAVRKLRMGLELLHNDTTSFSVHGDYENGDDLNITYGHNKDGRPDLKQIVLGLGVTPQRIPIAAKVENGNLDDKTWNHAFIIRLRTLLSDEEWDGLTYVADSALATMDNINLMMREGLSFITRLPETFDLCADLKEEALWKNDWENAGPFSEGTGKARYYVQSFARSLYGHDLRFVVVHSDQLEALQTETLRRQITKERTAINKQLQRLQAERFNCKHDAQQAIEAFHKQQKGKWHICDLAVQEEAYTQPRQTRGRPKANESLQTGTHWKVMDLGVRMNDETVTAKSHKLGMFVLMTNHAASEHWTSAKVLQSYKGQEAAETRFRLFKDPSFLDAIYLKQPHRIEALGIVMVMALLVYGVLEWRVRENLKQESEPLILPGKRKSFKPTAEMLLALLQSIQLTLQTVDGKPFFPKHITRNDGKKMQILDFTGFCWRKCSFQSSLCVIIHNEDWRGAPSRLFVKKIAGLGLHTPTSLFPTGIEKSSNPVRNAVSSAGSTNKPETLSQREGRTEEKRKKRHQRRDEVQFRMLMSPDGSTGLRICSIRSAKNWG